MVMGLRIYFLDEINFERKIYLLIKMFKLRDFYFFYKN